MPSDSPRIMLTVPRDLFEVIGELARAAGKPRATVITEILSEARPAMQSMASMLMALKSNPQGVRQMMDQAAGQAVLNLGVAGQALHEALDALPSAKPKLKRKAA